MNNLLKLLGNRFQNFINKKSICLFKINPSVHNIRKVALLNTKVYRSELLQPITINTPLYQKLCSRAAYDINTKVAKDVILYKYENPRFFKILNIFAVCQFIFWAYLSNFAFTTLRDAPVELKEGVEQKWYERINLGENKYRNGITIITFLIGYGILFSASMFTLRSVRFLILRKGGENITLVTYGPFGNNRMMTIPIKCISAQQPRESADTLLPLKVRDRSLFYVLDMKGEFKNTQLYDYTAGLYRHF